MFNIEITKGKKKRVDSILYATGLITIEDFQETLLIPLGFWDEKKYQRHWKEQISNFVYQQLDRTFLITEIFDAKQLPPKTVNTLGWWIFYREKNRVIIQQEFLALNELKSEFTLEGASQFIDERQTHTDEGNRISEWETSISSLQEFLERSNG